MIFAIGLQDDGDDSHDGFDDAELQSRLENTLQFRKQAGWPARAAPRRPEVACICLHTSFRDDV